MFRSHATQGLLGPSSSQEIADNLQGQDSEAMSDEVIGDVLAMLLGAGSDTTSAVLQIFFKVMALHPEVVDTAQAGQFHGILSWLCY